MDSLVGSTVDGRYQIEERVGEGGMGAVYKAQHLAMAQTVALKVLLTDQSPDETVAKRFVREARSSFKLDHANCVRVTDFGAMEDGTLYMVMEFLDGFTLGREISQNGPMDSERACNIAIQASQALDYAHSKGLIHRDLKPANIMLMERDGTEDFVKVFDFGLAKLFDNGAMLTGLSMSPLTQTGIVFGTPEYMSPEQAMGGELGPKSDIYSLGVCCYEMLTGSRPFTGENFMEILTKHVKETPKSPIEARPDLQIDPTFSQIVMACLNKDPQYRPTAKELADTLTRSGMSGQMPVFAATPTTPAPIDLGTEQENEESPAQSEDSSPAIPPVVFIGGLAAVAAVLLILILSLL